MNEWMNRQLAPRAAAAAGLITRRTEAETSTYLTLHTKILGS